MRLACLLVAACCWVTAPGCRTDRVDDAAESETTLEPPVWIVGGRIVDGTGAPAYPASLRLEAGRIAAIVPPSSASSIPDDAARIDADGLVVAPGFIDLHSHADLLLLADEPRRFAMLEAKIRQGVTTIVLGNCGLGAAPADDTSRSILAGVNGWMTPAGVEAAAWDTAGYLARLESQALPLHVATLVPHGPIRIGAMGLAPGRPSVAQLEAMQTTLRQSLEAGAYGLSVGLIYPPGMFSDTDELVALGQIVADVDGLFTAHVRGSSELLLPATEELLSIGRQTGVRLQHSHLEAVGDAFWPTIEQVLALEDQARAEGLTVGHDVFPYFRAATMMVAIFPPWALEGGVPALLQRLTDPTERRRIAMAMTGQTPRWPPWVNGGWPHNLVGAVGWDGILVAALPEDAPQDWVGRSLASIAAEQGSDPFDVVADLLLEHAGQVGQLVAEISGSDDHPAGLVRILRHPAGAVISDAEDYGRGMPHPAHAGAFARALRWNRERALISLEAMVHKMTGLPAQRLGLDERGTIQLGAIADLTLFDPERIADRADWNHPRAHAEGIERVLVAGQTVVHGSAYRPGAYGSVLRRGATVRGVR